MKIWVVYFIAMLGLQWPMELLPHQMFTGAFVWCTHPLFPATLRYQHISHYIPLYPTVSPIRVVGGTPLLLLKNLPKRAVLRNCRSHGFFWTVGFSMSQSIGDWWSPENPDMEYIQFLTLLRLLGSILVPTISVINLDPSSLMVSISWLSGYITYFRQITLWLFNIAMEHGPFIDALPIKHGDFPWLC